MAFHRLACGRGTSSLAGHVTASLLLLPSHGRKSVRSAARFALSADVATRIGCGQGDRVELLWGDGPDLGKVLILPGQDGRGITLKATRTKSGSLWATFGHLPDRPLKGIGPQLKRLALGKAIPSQPVQWEIGPEGGLVVLLPSCWWAASEGEAKVRALAAVPMPPARAAS